MKARTPPKLIPPFQSTAASGTLPIEQTKLRIATSGAMSHPTFAKFWGPLIAPLVAILSFVCSIGNVPLAAVLWNGGISFGGVLAFIFADLIVLPVLDIYRKYYGWRTAGFLLATFYA